MFLEPCQEEDLFPATKWHDIGEGIAWRNYKHWGTGVWAGEGLEIHNEDGSGCKRQFGGSWWTSVPIVVEARTYQKGNSAISAVFSYPGGIGILDEYFWEIYPVEGEDIELFTSEEEMETRIKKLFAEM